MERSFLLHEAPHRPENEQDGAAAERFPVIPSFSASPHVSLNAGDLSAGVLISVVSPSASRRDTAGLDGVPAGDVPDAAVDKTA